jgi:hypothetical protein
MGHTKKILKKKHIREVLSKLLDIDFSQCGLDREFPSWQFQKVGLLKNYYSFYKAS